MTQDNAPTHIAFAKKYVSKKLFIWLEIGKGRQDKNGQFHGMLDRTPIGGFNGYVCYVPVGSKPPEPEPDRPVEGTDAEGDEIL
jgi:hypothetical protein